MSNATTLLDAFFDAIDSTEVMFAQRASRTAKQYAASLTLGEVAAVYLGQSDRWDEVHEIDPVGADLIHNACTYAVHVMAKDVATPKVLMSEEEFLTSLYDLEGHVARTHQEWVAWVYAVGETHPPVQDLQAAFEGLLETLHTHGVEHGRFYIQQSLAWVAWNAIQYGCVRATQWPGMEIGVRQGCAALMALMEMWRKENGEGLEVMEGESLMDSFDEESGKKACSFASVVSVAGRRDQRPPFPEDFAELFAGELEAFTKKRERFVQRNRKLVLSTKAHVRAVVVGQ